MGQTPDRTPGPADEEGIVWEEQTSDPTQERQQTYVQGKGLVIFEHGVVRAVGEGEENAWQPPVDDLSVNTPPGSPSVGDRVIVGDSPTGDFVGHAGEIAQWSGSAWVFTTPREGSVVYVADETKLYQQTATSTPWTWEDALATGGAVFGTQPHYAESEGESTTTSTTFQSKVTFTTSSLPSGTYRCVYSAEINNANGWPTELRWRVDGTTEALPAAGEYSYDEWFAFGAEIERSLSGVVTVDVFFRTQQANKTARIRRARIALWRKD